MNNYNNCNDFVLYKGYAYYEDMTPVVNALVIIEVISQINTKNKEQSIYTTTNQYGEYCFRIYNRNNYYRIKIYN